MNPLAPLAETTDLRQLRAPWAPALCVVFARHASGQPGTGTGPSAGSARLRALGEVAEGLSLGPEAHPEPVPARDATGRIVLEDARALPGPEGLGSEGAAAQDSDAAARLAAFCEAAERAALALWWQGKLPGHACAEPPELAAYRAGHTGRRVLCLALPFLPGLSVRLMLGDDGTGGQIALGSAASPDPARAAEAATREMLQAELAWLAPAHHPDTPFRDHVQTALAPRLPALHTAQAAAPEPAGGSLEKLLGDLVTTYGFSDLTSPQLRVPVWRFVCPAWPRSRPLLAPAD
jgi:ribosomal protein S12 methylthiotransferase accessory factor YcaO